MKKADVNFYNAKTGCCPEFDPGPFDEKEFNWQDKPFLKDQVKCIFHIPLNFGTAVVRNAQKISAAGALTQRPPIVLCDETNPWKTDLYIETSKQVTGADMAALSGVYMTKVFEGPYKEVRNWYTKMNEYVRSKGRQPKKMYAYYTTCPKCAKTFGKNYVVMVAQV